MEIAWLRAAALGATIGVRSMSAPANLAWATVTGRVRTDGVIRFAADPDVAGLLTLMAAGEMLVDKTGVLPSRTRPLPLAARILIGGACGAALADSESLPPATGAAIGAAAAGLSAMITVRIRERLDGLGVPDALVGLAEDAIVTVVGRAAACETNGTDRL